MVRSHSSNPLHHALELKGKTLASFDEVWRLPLASLTKFGGCSSKVVTATPSFDACLLQCFLDVVHDAPMLCSFKGRGLRSKDMDLNFDGSSSSLGNIDSTQHTFLELMKLLDLPIQAQSVSGMIFEGSKMMYQQ